MKVTFTDEDRLKACEIIHQRVEPKREHQIVDTKVAVVRWGYSIAFLGMLAEMAVCKALKADLVDKITIHKDDGYDLTWHGWKVEVKYTFHTDGLLIARVKEHISADILVLVIGNENEMQLIGWIDRESFLKEGQYRELGYGPTFSLRQNQLRSFKEWDYLPIKKTDRELSIVDFM